jgi:hypothetical protein
MAITIANTETPSELDFGHSFQNEIPGKIAADKGLIEGTSQAQEFRDVCLSTKPHRITAQHWRSLT